MKINSDFADLFRELNGAGAKYLIVGGLALAFHDQPRFTKDVDIFVARTAENAALVHGALAHFGAPLQDLSIEDLTSPGVIFQIGMDPIRIDVLTDIDGVTFDQAWENRVKGTYGDVPVLVIGRAELIANKLASGRTQDFADVEKLRARRTDSR